MGYTQTELVDDVEAVEHDLVREAMKLTDVVEGIEISTMADIPSRGSGLGSSSSVSVALLHALWQHRGALPSRHQLAEGAVEIELQRLGRPMGVQDQYAAAYGGLRFMTLEGDSVHTERIAADGAMRRRLDERLLLFFTGITRRSGTILDEQVANIESKRLTLREMADMARIGREALEAGDLDAIGRLMHEGWMLKRGLASRVSNPDLDRMYQAAIDAGAIGGKISGAGGGGFLLFYCPPERQANVRAALHSLIELEFHLEGEGSLVMLDDRRR